MHPVVIARCPIETSRSAHPAALHPPPSHLRALLRALVAAIALPLVAFAAMPSLAADERPTGGRVATVTRLVKVFLEREGAIGEAIRSGDAQVLASLLTDDFEMRTGARAATPVPRAEWIREVLRTREGGDGIEHMAVHDFGTIAIVSFTMSASDGPIFVVDVWRAQGSTPKLAVRYASPAGMAQFAIPGADAQAPELPKKF
jgi:hypothetical protein